MLSPADRFQVADLISAGLCSINVRGKTDSKGGDMYERFRYVCCACSTPLLGLNQLFLVSHL